MNELFFCLVTASHSVSLSHHTFYGRVSNNRERALKRLTGPGSRDPTLIFCLGAPEFLVTSLGATGLKKVKQAYRIRRPQMRHSCPSSETGKASTSEVGPYELRLLIEEVK